MKKLFQAIKKNDFTTVKTLLEAKPERVNCTAKKPPASDDGQSPLQVALKSGRLTIAEYLLDKGADVHFMESPACANHWRAPVLHDAINAAVMCARWNTYDAANDEICVFGDAEQADRAYRILARMLDAGADPNVADSFGNTGLWRFCIQAEQILPGFDWQKRTTRRDRLLTDDLVSDLIRVYVALLRAGLDTTAPLPVNGMTTATHYAGHPIETILSVES